jgi:hypothetical protein
MVIRRDAHHLLVATQTDTDAKMSGKIIPAIIAAVLLAGTAAASAQSPSGQGAGSIASDALAGRAGISGGPGFYYNYAPGPGYYDYAPGPGYYDYAPAQGHHRRARVESAQPGRFGW